MKLNCAQSDAKAIRLLSFLLPGDAPGGYITKSSLLAPESVESYPGEGLPCAFERRRVRRP